MNRVIVLAAALFLGSPEVLAQSTNIESALAKSTAFPALQGLDLSEICITSGGDLVEGDAPDGAFVLADVAGVGVVPALAEGNKCARCWQVLEEVGKSTAHPLICRRCEDAVSA